MNWIWTSGSRIRYFASLARRCFKPDSAIIPSIGTADWSRTSMERLRSPPHNPFCHSCIYSIHYIMSWIYVNFWWPRIGSNHRRSRLQRDALPLSYLAKIMHIDRIWTCTSDGYLPAGLSMEFNHKGHCLFYQTQLPLCVYLFRHECIEN